MDWVRTDLYQPNNDNDVVTSYTEARTAATFSTAPSSSQLSSAMALNEDNAILFSDTVLTQFRKRKCPLHKQIRQGSWSNVLAIVRADPHQVTRTNAYGWSSITLAVYHSVPTHILSELLLALSQVDPKHETLAHAVPNGGRLCLHFACRYLDDPEAIRLLTEAYPKALLVASQDGITPLERALYYRKDQSILEYLTTQTKQQQILAHLNEYNQILKWSVVMACCLKWKQRNGGDRQHKHQSMEELVVVGKGNLNETEFITRVYGYLSEREMVGVLSNIVSYVGMRHLPENWKSSMICDMTME